MFLFFKWHLLAAINNYYSLSHRTDPCYRQSPASPHRYYRQNHHPNLLTLDNADNGSH